MKTAELTGALLDYWVARAMGYQTDITKIKPGGDWCDIEMRNVAPPDFTISGEHSACDIAMVPNAIREFPACVIGQKIGRGKYPYRSSWFYPSKVWDHGGPIIEREKIDLMHVEHRPAMGGKPTEPWNASMQALSIDNPDWDSMSGTTPLEAAMRAFVGSRFGVTVDDMLAAAWVKSAPPNIREISR